jgi:hypothetical protein
MADNDYALGLPVQKVANSPYRDSTLIFVIEDDAQDGPDHVDAHRSITYVVGPYVKQGAVVSKRFTTVSIVTTVEALLGVEPSSRYSAANAPMAEIFDLNQPSWNYNAIVPDLLRVSQLPLLAAMATNSLPRTRRVLASARDKHTAAYRQKKLATYGEDKLDTPRFNRELWRGMMGGKAYPKRRSGKNLRQGRRGLLAAYGIPSYP